MLSACERVEKTLLHLKQSDPDKYETLIKGYNIMFCTQWGACDRTGPAARGRAVRLCL